MESAGLEYMESGMLCGGGSDRMLLVVSAVFMATECPLLDRRSYSGREKMARVAKAADNGDKPFLRRFHIEQTMRYGRPRQEPSFCPKGDGSNINAFIQWLCPESLNEVCIPLFVPSG